MPVHLDHTIVAARAKRQSAAFLADGHVLERLLGAFDSDPH